MWDVSSVIGRRADMERFGERSGELSGGAVMRMQAGECVGCEQCDRKTCCHGEVWGALWRIKLRGYDEDASSRAWDVSSVRKSVRGMSSRS